MTDRTDPKITEKGFDPGEPRDGRGRWTGNFSSSDDGVVAYHGTRKDVVDQIKREGIKSKASRQVNPESGGYKDYRDHAVFVTSSPNDARGYAEMRSTDDKKAVVLELRIPKDEWGDFIKDQRHWSPDRGAYTHKDIPASWIVGEKEYKNRNFSKADDGVTAYAIIIVAEPRTLYASRPLVNGADLVEWARRAGFKKTLPSEDMHVTLAYSRAPLEWPAADASDVSARGGDRSVTELGDQGAVVLKFECPALTARWRELVDAGAEWGYDTFQPHVTFTMDPEGIDDLGAVEPYEGALEFGPERFKEIKTDGENWADEARSRLITKGDSPGHPFRGNQYSEGGASVSEEELSRIGHSDKTPKVFWRGENPGDTRRIRTGVLLFVSSKRDSASAYGSHLTQFVAEPDAKILYEGTKDFVNTAGKWRRGESMLDFAARATRSAKDAGYDAIHFHRQGDIGTAIFNPEKFRVVARGIEISKNAEAPRVRAAGVVLVVPTGEVLFVRRSKSGDAAGTWCCPGGGIKGDETPAEAAARECREEVGYALDPADLAEVCRRDDGRVDYTTFITDVAEPFKPTLDHEHTDYAWELLADAPGPLHPGLEADWPHLLAAVHLHDTFVKGYDPDEPRDHRGRWAHWFSRTPLDPYVYHGTTEDHLDGIKRDGLTAFLRTYFAADPKVAMNYGFRSNLHHEERGRGRGGVLLRVKKEHVDPESYRSKRNEDFWTGPDTISPDKIEIRRGGRWEALVGGGHLGKGDTVSQATNLVWFDQTSASRGVRAVEWNSNDDLPPGVKKRLPDDADQTRFRECVNAALARGDDMMSAVRGAWGDLEKSPRGLEKAAPGTSDVSFFMPISKREPQADGSVIVTGYATTPSLDLDGERISLDAVKKALPSYMEWRNIRAMHRNEAVGTAKEANVDDRGLFLRARIVEPAAVHLVNEGVYQGFSIGGRKLQKKGDTITDIDLIEISVVDRPCNGECKFMIAKSATGGAARVLDPSKVELLLAQDTTEVTFDRREVGFLGKILAKLGLGADLNNPVTRLKELTQDLDMPSYDDWIERRSAEITKGDKPGHPFRGNQHTGESGGSFKAPSDNPYGAVGAMEHAKAHREEARRLIDRAERVMKTGDKDTALDHLQRAHEHLNASGHYHEAVDHYRRGDNLDGNDAVDRVMGSDHPHKAALVKSASYLTVTQMLTLLAQMENLEERCEGDDLSIMTPNGRTVECDKDFTDRFGSVVVQFGALAVELLDKIVSDIRDEEADEAAEDSYGVDPDDLASKVARSPFSVALHKRRGGRSVIMTLEAAARGAPEGGVVFDLERLYKVSGS